MELCRPHTLTHVHTEMAEALKAGRLSKEILQRFLNLQNSILAPLLGIGYAQLFNHACRHTFARHTRC